MSDATATPLKIKTSWLLGTLLAFSLFAIIAIYSYAMTWHHTDYDQKRAKERYKTLADLQAEANKTLTTADWMDQGKGIVRIPIDEAMAVEVETLKAKPAQMGSALPVATPPPAPAAAPAAPDTSKAPETNAAPAAPAKPTP